MKTATETYESSVAQLALRSEHGVLAVGPARGAAFYQRGRR